MRVLVVEDDPTVRRHLSRMLRANACEVIDVASKEAALESLATGAFDAQLVDVGLVPGREDRSGLDVVARAAANANRGPSSVVITGSSDPDIVRASLRAGAMECIPKGGLSSARIVRTLRLASDARGPHASASTIANARRPLAGLLGTSAAMADVRQRIERYAPRDDVVLITGPSGTGKELVARALHERSGRTGPFKALNVGAVGGPLFASALFGHRRGAFTGANADHDGFFAEAAHGTLFLDEIGELGLAEQVHLLRVLQEREYTPLGSTKSVAVEARVVLATHRDLGAMVSAGTFREDLHSRINVLRIGVPSLAARPDDIAPIATRFANVVEGMMLSDAALDWLSRREYRTNVRELESVILRAAVHARGRPHLDVADFEAEDSDGAARATGAAGLHGPSVARAPIRLRDRMRDLELREVKRALAACEGNVAAAARLLGENPQYVLRCLRERERERERESKP